jgi:hypothetical protein
MKTFTVDEANRTLPLVRRIVGDIVATHRVWREKILELDLIATSARADSVEPRNDALEREMQDLAREIDGFERELTRLGIQVKDRRLGLIDFPSMRNGRQVLLCWRLGEPDVGHWHETDVGFRGRRPLEPTMVGEAGERL